jgi:hypothetical protein
VVHGLVAPAQFGKHQAQVAVVDEQVLPNQGVQRVKPVC